MSRRRGSGYWTEARLAILRDAWDQGLSTNAIARLLGTSKNTVVGKAHRLRLPARPSPIMRGDYVPPARQKATPAPAETLPPLPSAVAPLPMAPLPVVPQVLGTGKCLYPRWPHGAPPSHEYCGQRTPLGSSWCDACRRLVWTRRAA